MTNWQKSFQKRPPSFVTLKKGLYLFHGTDAVEFDQIRGPAWFSSTIEGAKEWCSWKNEPWGGKNRVLRYQVKSRIRLVDLTNIEEWQNAGMVLYKNPDPETKQLARAFEKAGICGWVQRQEAMIVRPSKALVLDGVAWSAK